MEPTVGEPPENAISAGDENPYRAHLPSRAGTAIAWHANPGMTSSNSPTTTNIRCGNLHGTPVPKHVAHDPDRVEPRLRHPPSEVFATHRGAPGHHFRRQTSDCSAGVS
jgi:hypothetical protein